MKRQRPVDTVAKSPKDRLSSNPLVGTSTIWTILIGSLMLSRTVAFSFPSKAFVPRPTRLHSTRAAAAESVVQAVQPKRFSSMKERREAQEAMIRHRVPPADNLVNAQMLELLSDQFLYPKKPKPKRERPRGRPESVPGAMSYETMLKFRQQEEQEELLTVIPYSTPVEPAVSPTFDTKEGATKKRKNNAVRGSARPETEKTTKERKKVVKNLPKPKEAEELVKQKLTKPARRSRSDKSVDLQKYYRTELLTAKEEYSLGMQVHFVMKCEEVHEGLAAKLMRLPTMEEWAHACG